MVRLGGWVGFHSQFSYPHTANKTDLPFCLKGADMAVFEALTALGLQPLLRIVVLEPFNCDVNEEFEPAYIRLLQPLAVEDELMEEGYGCEQPGMDYYLDSLKKFSRGTTYRDEPFRDIGFNEVWWMNRPQHEEIQLVHIVVGHFTRTP